MRLEKDYRQRSARHKLKKHNKMADEVIIGFKAKCSKNNYIERLLAMITFKTKLMVLFSFQFLKQQVEYLREDGKNKRDHNERLTIVETDGNIKMSSSDVKGKLLSNIFQIIYFFYNNLFIFFNF